MRGYACPKCGGFARPEPGGLRCITGGHLLLLPSILPRDHELSGTDWKNRARQRALDQAMLHGSRVEAIIFDMLDRLEGRVRDEEEEPAGEVAAATA